MYENFTKYLISALLGGFILLVLFLKRCNKYWTRKGVYQSDPDLIFGHIKPLVRRQTNFGQLATNLYNDAKSKGHKYAGAYIFIKPMLIVVSPDLIKCVMTTDFQHFNSHGAAFSDDGTEPLGGHLFNLDGQKWKTLRVKLTPTFTSGKMKMMFNTMQTCTAGFKDMLDDYAASGEPVNIKDILGRYTTDVIGSCAFGLDCNSIKDPNTEFRVYGKRAVALTPWENIKILLVMALPTAVKKALGVKVTPSEVEKFFFSVVANTVKYREENNVVRKDFMHLLLQLKNKGKVTDDEDIKTSGEENNEWRLDMTELTAQAFLFFTAGFETSSTTMTFALYELATNPEIQVKVKEEINEVLKKYNGEVTYDSVKEMTYLDQVVNETLRKHPPVVAVPRECTKDYTIPDTNIVIEKGTLVQIPAQGLHMDPDYFPDPEKFDPERFSEKNKSNIKQYTYLPFGDGPRVCIGLRFGLLQSKLGLIAILRNYKVEISGKTELPIKMDPASFIIKTIDGDLWLNVKKS